MSTAFEAIAKKRIRQKQRKPVVHVPSAMYHESSRTQPKLDRKCVGVGVDAGMLFGKKKDLTSMAVPQQNVFCNRTKISPQGDLSPLRDLLIQNIRPENIIVVTGFITSRK